MSVAHATPSLRLAPGLAMPAALAACKPASEPGTVLLQARMEIDGASGDDGTCPGCTPDIAQTSDTSDPLAPTMARLVWPVVRDGRVAFDAVDNRPPTFGGAVELRCDRIWSNFEATFAPRIAFDRRWHDGTPSTVGSKAQLAMNPIAAA